MRLGTPAGSKCLRTSSSVMSYGKLRTAHMRLLITILLAHMKRKGLCCCVC